jgi:hypothetical protein
MQKDIREEEIKITIFEMKNNKAPGPNGFLLAFIRQLGQ